MESEEWRVEIELAVGDVMEYRKSYKAFVIWLVVYLAAMFSPMLLPKDTDAGLVMRLVFNLTSLGLVVLMWIIWRTESVYWINGTTFEQARDAGSARRRAFALAHMKVFARFALGYAIFSIIMQLQNVGFVADIVAFCVGLIASALLTLRIRL